MVRKFFEISSFLDNSPVEDLIYQSKNSFIAKQAVNTLMKLLYKQGSSKTNHQIALKTKELWRKFPDSVSLQAILPYFQSPDRESVLPEKKQLCMENLQMNEEQLSHKDFL